MGRRIWMLAAALALLLPASGWAQRQLGGFGCYNPPMLYPYMTQNGTTITSTLPILLPVGSVSAPSIQIGQSDQGFYRPGSGTVDFVAGGIGAFRLTTSSIQIPAATVIYFLSGLVGTGGDGITLAREAAAILQVGPDAATATSITIKGADSTGATVAGASVTLKAGAGTSGIANGGALILAGGANSSTGEPGAVAISDGGTKPTCAAGIRGSIWYDAGGAGVADTFEVCRKDAANAYAWVTLF